MIKSINTEYLFNLVWLKKIQNYSFLINYYIIVYINIKLHLYYLDIKEVFEKYFFPKSPYILDEFTKYLVDKTKLLNDLEKASLLFNWIGNNIEYDYEGMLNNTANLWNK